MGESFRQIPEDYREANEYDRGLESGQGLIEFVPASVKKRNRFNKELGPIIGITDIDNLDKLRRKLQAGKTIPQLDGNILDLEKVNFLRNYYGFDALGQEEYEALQSPAQEQGEKVTASIDTYEDKFRREFPNLEVNVADTSTDKEKYEAGFREKFPNLEVNVTPVEESEQTELQRVLAETVAIVEEEAKQNISVDDPWYTEAQPIGEINFGSNKNEAPLTSDPWKSSSEVEFVPNSQVEQVSDTPIIEASFEIEKTDKNIDISEYERLGLSDEQLVWVKSGIKNGYTREQIALYTNPALETSQIYAIQHGIMSGLTVEQISEYAKPEYTWEQMRLKKELLLNPDIDISEYEGLGLTDLDLSWIIDAIKRGDTPEQIALYTKSNIELNVTPVDEVTSSNGYKDNFQQIFPNLEVNVAPAEEQLSIEELESYINKEINPEEIEKLKQEANAAIYLYQQFGDMHPPHTRDQATQEQYRQLETKAWDEIDKLAHLFGGGTITLPHQRDLELAHPEQIDLGEKLEDLGYKFNQNGEITHIQLHGNTIELDRPRSVTELLEGARPTHIVYGYGENLLYDNDENKHYIGYVVRGLNPHTSEFIESRLSDKEFLSSVIVDDKNIQSQKVKDSYEAGFESITGLEANVNPSSRANIANLRTQYAKAEEFYNKNRSDENGKSELERLREEYNKTVEKTFGIMAAEGLELEIHKTFVQEVKNLRDERILQSQELQSGFERVINPLKEKFVNFAIKHKKIIGRLNLVAFGVGTTLALTGVGLPVAGGLAVLRRSVGGLMSGVSSRELARAGFEDGDINLFKGKIKWQAAIPKLVGESLQEGYIKGAKDADLSTKLSTLEAYYRLNGGTFTNESQQTAYESILNELGSRVQQENIINQSEKEVNTTTIHEVRDETINSENSNSDEGEVKVQPEKFVFSSPEQNQQYTSRLLTVLSEKRITELQKQQQKRKAADIIGFATGGTLLTIGTLLDAHRASVSSNPGTANSLEESTKTAQSSIETTGTATSEVAKAATQQLSVEQVKDISELSKGETLWGEVAKKLGSTASEAQIQQGVETYMHTSQGSETIFNLASQTEQGKALLGQLGVDNAGELSQLSNTDLYAITQHLGTGQLQGLDSLDLQNITASSVSSPIEVLSVTTATPEQLLSKFTQAPDTLDFPEGAKPLTQINNYIDRFAGDLPHDSSLGQEVLTTYLNTPEGKDWLYDAIVNNPERLSGNQNIQFVEEYFRQKGIKSGVDIDWANLTQDKRFPTSMFWRETSLTGGRKIPPLSTLLKPSTMPGIKKALEQVLTLKQ